MSRLLDLVGDDAADEVRMSRVQVVHQLHQRLTMSGGDGHQGGTCIKKKYVSVKLPDDLCRPSFTTSKGSMQFAM